VRMGTALHGDKASKPYSVELCGGTHVSATGDIGIVRLVSEGAVASGVRRIEAVCGRAALREVERLRRERAELSESLKTPDPLTGVRKLREQIRRLKGELDAALAAGATELKEEKIGEVTVIVDEVAAGDIKKMIDEIKNRHEKVAVMLFMKKGEKVLLAAGSKNTPVKAGDWIKKIAPILGGGGGGRADFAQAGGKEPSKLPEAMKAAKAYIDEIYRTIDM